MVELLHGNLQCRRFRLERMDISESGKGEAVKTGDTANTVLWMMWGGISVSAMALTLRKGKVKR